MSTECTPWTDAAGIKHTLPSDTDSPLKMLPLHLNPGILQGEQCVSARLICVRVCLRVCVCAFVSQGGPVSYP